MSWERQMIRELQQLGISLSEVAFQNRFSKKHAILVQTPRLSYSASLLYFIAARIFPTPGLTSTKSRGIDHEKSIHQYDQSLQIQDLHSPQVPSSNPPIPSNINQATD
jgi:hypothetical protein